jgi:RNA polymerase sigma-70 factor (ECF subfamily)
LKLVPGSYFARPIQTASVPAETDVKPQFSAGTLAEIYNDYFTFVWRNARRLGVPESSADDVVQEVFIVVQRRLPDYDGRAHVRSWLFGILTYVVQRYHRSIRRKDARCVSLDQEGGGDGLEIAQHGSTSSAPLEDAELARVLEGLLGQLDESQRTLIILSELEEWTLRELAEHTGSNINTVYSRLRAAKREFERLYRGWLASEGGVP